MTDQTSKTPLEEEIAMNEAEIADKHKLIHRIKTMVRDASTNLEIDGYRKFPTGREGVTEWELRRGDKVYRLLLIELPE